MTKSFILQVGAEMRWLGQLKMNRSGLNKTKQQTDIEPHQPSFRLVFEKDRLETFKENWKELKGFKNCTPENFAAAGFYNLNVSNKNISDTVKCFSCQKELSDWEKEDDPWLEHVKRGTKCPFVLFKSKEKTTVKDFLELQYETKKILLENYFEEQKQILQEKEKEILKTITNKQRGRR